MRTSQLLTVSLLVSIVAACQQSPEASSQTTAAAPAETLRIATDATFEPFHFIESGQPTGFDVELARRVAARAGFTPEIVVVSDFDQLFTDLVRGDVDLVAATTGMTQERAERFSFSTPYFTTCQAVVVRIGDDEPQSLAELAGHRVGASGATTSLGALEGLAARIELTPVQLVKGQSGSDLLLQGDIDALIIDEFDALTVVKDHPEQVRVLREPAALEEYGFVMRKDEAELKERIDGALGELRSEGVLLTLTRDYGLTRDEYWPIDVRTRAAIESQ